jgi:hypothetical protein
MKKKTLSQKVVGHLKKEASKRKVGKVIGLTRNQQTQKAIEDAFGSNF